MHSNQPPMIVVRYALTVLGVCYNIFLLIAMMNFVTGSILLQYLCWVCVHHIIHPMT
jgi:hypothetical protein